MKRFVYLLLLALPFTSLSQTYTAGGGGIPDGGPMVSFPLTVSGLSPAAIDTIFGLETICLDITHTWDADLNISLQAPDGTIVDLSIANGNDGDNYTNTCFNAYASSSIVINTAPFTGTFRPQGFIGAINNGQNGNGTWNLLVQDTYGADVGTLNSWSITFGTNPAKPFSFTSSNLPIVSINTFGNAIPDQPKLAAYMGIIYNGPGARNNLTDPFNSYSNNIGIELRGSSSMGFPQKSYGFETRDINGTQHDTTLLGMPDEHDWILYAPYDDKTCMRNVLSYDIANKTGHYASRTRFCELVVNGQYQGIYVLMEKVKRDPNRVDISKLQSTDISGDELTGGYIIKIDKQTGGGGSGWNSSFPSTTGSNIFFQYSYPKDVDIAPQQQAYIQSYVDSFEVALHAPNFDDPLNGYRKYCDVNSFIDYFILDEVSRNVDGYRLSTYLHKQKDSQGGKLRMGPAWDYNLGWWNANYCDGDQSTGWAYQFGLVCGGDFWQIPSWWDRFMLDTQFKNDLKCRWTELRQSTLSNTTLYNYVDSVGAYLDEAQGRHFQAWPILGAYTWPNPSPIPTSYAGELSALKSWITDRMAWLDSNMPGICNVGIADNTAPQYNVNVFPNPFSDNATVDLDLRADEMITVEVFDVPGKCLLRLESKMYHSGKQQIPLVLQELGLNAGMYFVKVAGAQGSVVKPLSKIR